jgi:hypothetical protein
LKEMAERVKVEKNGIKGKAKLKEMAERVQVERIGRKGTS